MEILSPLYGLGDVSGERELGRRQYEQVTPSVLKDEELAQMVRRLEREYDRKIAATDQETDETVELSPEIERFLDQLRRRVDEGPSDDEDEPGDRGD
jgi:hypothetical protein